MSAHDFDGAVALSIKRVTGITDRDTKFPAGRGFSKQIKENSGDGPDWI